MLARLSRYHFPPGKLGAVMRAHWAAVQADPFIYERGLLAAFVFSDRDSGEAFGLTVADTSEALRCTHTEPAGAVPEEVHNYGVVETFAVEPREGVDLFAEIAHAVSLPAADDSLCAAFLLENVTTRRTVAISVTQEPGRYTNEYFMLRDSLLNRAEAHRETQPQARGGSGMDRTRREPIADGCDRARPGKPAA